VGRKRIGEVGSLVALGLVCGTLASAAPSPAPLPRLTLWQQLQHRCRYLARDRLAAYPWPVKPFHRQHPVRGNFGDPRTVFTGPDEGAFSFHNGIDISAWPGNRVYPVKSGIAVRVTGDLVSVETPGGRRFQYIHLAPEVHVGEEVTALKTVLGLVRPRWNHIHLTELREDCAVNPLMPHHLEPYRDTTKPTIRAIFFQSRSREPLEPGALAGKIRIIADAFDTPELSSPYPWGRLPVSPNHVSWRLTTFGGRLVAKNTAVDFRYGEPPRQAFCTVYAPGTEQNFAAVDGTFNYGKAGRYLFDLTPSLIDVSRLPPGRYRVEVTASDVDGNWATRSVDVRIVPGHGPPGRTAPDQRCDSENADSTLADRLPAEH
jgi:hypothetical protein